MIDADDLMKVLDREWLRYRNPGTGLAYFYQIDLSRVIDALARGYDADAMDKDDSWWNHDCGKDEYCPQFGKEFLRSYREHSDNRFPEWSPVGDTLDPRFDSDLDWDAYMGDVDARIDRDEEFTLASMWIEIGGEG